MTLNLYPPTDDGMIPPDFERCQASPNVLVHNAFSLGPMPKPVQCSNTPAWIAVEMKPGKDGKRGSMSLCEACAILMMGSKDMRERVQLQPILRKQHTIPAAGDMTADDLVDLCETKAWEALDREQSELEQCGECEEKGLCPEDYCEHCTAAGEAQDAASEWDDRASNIREVIEAVDDANIDTSDIPEVNEEWFKKAKLKKLTPKET